MDDRIKESVSALLDNEADELELRRVLNHSDDRDMRAVWSRYSKVSNILSSGQHSCSSQDSYEGSQECSSNGFLDIDISSQVSRSIDQIDEIDVATIDSDAATVASPETINKNRFGLISTVAVAATIIIAVSLLFKPFNEAEVRNEVLVAYNDRVDVSQTAADDGISGISSEYQHLSGYVANVSNVDTVPMAIKPFSPEHARMLNQYLLRHAENSVAGGRSGLMPLARVASFTIAKN